jgi:MATE family multidrug resistance protein
MFSAEYRNHYKNNYILAYPVVLGQLGHMLTSIADTMMVGRLGSVQLAAASLANTVYIIPMLFAIGVGMGLTPLVGKAFGAKDYITCRQLFKHGIILNLAVGFIIALFLWIFSFIFHYLGQQQDVVHDAIPYYNIVSFSIIQYMLFINSKQFLEGLKITKPAMIVSIAGNLLNILLNYIFIFGKFGFEQMGLIGAGWATFISRIAMGVALLFYIFFHKQLMNYIRGINIISYTSGKIKEMVRIGFPIGIQLVFEVGIFSAGAIIIGWFGEKSLAAHQIAINMAALTYMMATGISASATISISNYLGSKDFRSMRLVGYSSFIMVIVFMSITATIFILGSKFLPTLYIHENEVIRIASSLLIIAAFFQLFDGIQVTALGALRGLHDVKIPTYIVLFSYWGVSMPICYILSVKYNLEARGVWFGYLCGLLTAAILLYFRYEIVSRKFIRSSY